MEALLKWNTSKAPFTKIYFWKWPVLFEIFIFENYPSYCTVYAGFDGYATNSEHYNMDTE